jgi:transcriptional regulator with XRE-family HTH domain
MAAEIDFSTATSGQIEAELCRQLRQIRLSRNVTQAQLAREAGVSPGTISNMERGQGVSPGTISNMERGQGVSLDTFLRVLIALGVQQNLQVLLPDISIRPMERISSAGDERKRARPSHTLKEQAPWAWGDEEEEDG